MKSLTISVFAIFNVKIKVINHSWNSHCSDFMTLSKKENAFKIDRPIKRGNFGTSGISAFYLWIKNNLVFIAFFIRRYWVYHKTQLKIEFYDFRNTLFSAMCNLMCNFTRALRDNVMQQIKEEGHYISINSGLGNKENSTLNFFPW